ncbi:uncharacterized protein LOC130902200 [Diorhabda carinulata]|uniref:uncharacterized protein LOC130902200 n=1 Tax=Diorhabda carinulata TaxID=1163345 RepID=UPI0025A06087|nr:uncharacterized protein LOC130902200 [Diorhabda carinulata]
MIQSGPKVYKMNVIVSPLNSEPSPNVKETIITKRDCSWRIKQLAKPSKITPKFSATTYKLRPKNYILEYETIDHPNRKPLWTIEKNDKEENPSKKKYNLEVLGGNGYDLRQ